MESAAQGGLGNYLPLIMMVVVVYFFMILPHLKKQKKEKAFQKTLKKGLYVVTTSGIHGKLLDLNDETIVVETSAGKIKFERASISMELSGKYQSKLAVAKK